MREDDDKYELKKALAELEKAKGKKNRWEELSKRFSSNYTPYAIQKKLNKALTKYVGASSKEETKEGSKEL